MFQKRDLTGLTALITGGSKGIGKEIALRLAKERVNIILFARTEADLKKAAESIEKTSILDTERNWVKIFVGDATSESDVKSLYEKLKQENIIVDILVNNTGVGKYGPFETFTIQDYDWLMNTNMRSTFLFSRYFVPPMLKRGDGDVFFVASVSGLAGLPGRAIYCASKNAQVAFAESLDAECRKKNVRITVIAPGGVHTDFAIGTGRTPNMPELEHMLTPADVAKAVHYAMLQNKKARVFLMGMRPLSETRYQ